MKEKQNIRQLSEEEIGEFLVAHNQKKFRSKQTFEWLWTKSARNFDEMTNLSKELREVLSQHFLIYGLQVSTFQKSTDETIKIAFKLHDENIIESVLIPTEKRVTACISSQVGCSLDCKFCATARLKRIRNLYPEEIYDQVAYLNLIAKEHYQKPISNIVLMGMGEPLLNYNNVIEGLKKITSQKNGLGIASKRITLSTVGIPKMIKKMADDQVKFNLAVSLHSAMDQKRSRVMPINEKNNLELLEESLSYWYQKRKRKVTFEYVVWKGINDTAEDIQALVALCRRIPSKVNLIQYNDISNPKFVQASKASVRNYMETLEKNRITTRIRISRGADIDAACGQLSNKIAQSKGGVSKKN